jgi:ATP-dependent protease Clp ATPase subunit
MEDGVYELKEINGHLFINAQMLEDGDIDEFMELTETGSYIFEKKRGSALLRFPQNMIVEQFDYLVSQDRFSAIITAFAKITACEDPLIYISSVSDYVLGLSTVRGRRLSHTKFTIYLDGYHADTLDDIEERCAKTNFQKYLNIKVQAVEPKKMLEYCQQRIQGQGLQLKKAVYMVYTYMQDAANGTLKQSSNWMLTAPSGSGKTEFYRAIKDFFKMYKIPIPVIQIDLSQITETGFKGSNANTIPESILRLNPKAGGVAICFLDEADKKFLPAYDSKGVNVNAAVQANLLTLIEGKSSSEDADGDTEPFDSNKTMFVFLGAFQSLRNEKRKKQNKLSSIGFCKAADRTETSEDEDPFYEDLTLEELIGFGLLEELAGRMVQIVNFHKLSKKDMRKLLLCKAAEISDEMNVKIELTERGMQELLDISFGSLGVRRPMNVIKELTQNAVAEVFFDKGFDRQQEMVIIDSADSAHIQRCRNLAANEAAVKTEHYEWKEQQYCDAV